MKQILGDLRKGVDFSDPKLPKMTMTTFDGSPYIEHYTLSKLEILPDFGTEKKAAPTPVRPSLNARPFPPWKAATYASADALSSASLVLFESSIALTRLLGAPGILEGLQAFKRGFWYAAVK